VRRTLDLLRDRNLALLLAGLNASLVGDGIFLVAMAWEAYRLSNRPSALALVGLALTGGTVLFLLVGGIVADRAPRRVVMMGADATRTALLALLGALTVSGELRLWMLVALAGLHGAADGFFNPASSALLPDVVPEERLVPVNGIMVAVRQISQRIVGPALGGVVVGLVGAGTGFLIDAATFAASLACVFAMRVREPPRPPQTSSPLTEMREGFSYVLRHAWIWATVLSATLALLVFYGPSEVLVPYVVKNDLHAGAASFGAFLAATGLGWVVGALWVGHRPMTQRPVRFMYLWWGWGVAPICAFGLVTATWQLALAGFGLGVGLSTGFIIWTTLMQTRVPRALRGRVSSVDWFLSMALMPVSFALTPAISSAIGIRWTFIGAGFLAGASTLALYYLIPSLRNEPRQVLGEAGVADGGGVHPHDLDPLGAGQPGDGPDHGEPVIAAGLDRPTP
jgi:MFS family permease